jgi:predicted glycosyltransferase
MKVWVDIDNPPQTRYLLPLARRFEEAGHDVVVTARDYGDTIAILESEDVGFESIGSSFGRGLPRKIAGLGARAQELRRFSRREGGTVDLVLTGSRSATLAARTLRIPSFVIVDYEYVDLSIFQLTGTTIVHPRIIGTARFRRRGIAAKRLLAFDGLKEDISFSGMDIEAVAPHDFGTANGIPRMLFRPPAEESHYYRRESRELALALLRYLAGKDGQIVFSPRFDWQTRDLEQIGSWRHEPIVLREPIPTVSLLKGVDAVISAGGTMLREAAYLGVPAYSIFRSRIGAVDHYLASIDRLSMLRSPLDFPQIAFQPRGAIAPLRTGSSAVDEVQRMISERVGGAGPVPPVDDASQDGDLGSNRVGGAERAAPKGTPPGG